MNYKIYINKQKHAKRIIIREMPETWDLIKDRPITQGAIADMEWWANFYISNPLPFGYKI